MSRPCTIQRVRVLASGVSCIETLTFPNAAARDAHEAKQTEQLEQVKRAYKADAAERVAANGGSDLVYLQEVSHPGEVELKKNLATLSPDWRQVNVKSLRFMIPTGAPPAATTATDRERWAKTVRERSGGRDVPGLIPIVWLGEQLGKLKVHADHMKRVLEVASGHAAATSADAMWVSAVGHYNGAVKTLAECCLYCPSA